MDVEPTDTEGQLCIYYYNQTLQNTQSFRAHREHYVLSQKARLKKLPKNSVKQTTVSDQNVIKLEVNTKKLTTKTPYVWE